MNTPERRAWAREHGICIDCSHPVEPNRIRCRKCLISDAKGTTRYLKNHLDFVSNREKRLKAKRKELGQCIRCGLFLGEQDVGHVKCQNCREEL